MTPETVTKLEGAFMLGCTDEEACLVADISKQTLYNYQKEHPEFIDRKEQLKQWPNYQARTSVIEGIKKDPELALKYLSKKKKDEFADRYEHTGDQGGAIELKTVKDMTPEEVEEFLKTKLNASTERSK